MISVEFFGPSGIGKSTFVNELAKKRGNAKWRTRDEELRLLGFKRSMSVKWLKIQINKYTGVDVESRSGTMLQYLMREMDADCTLLIHAFIENLYRRELKSWQIAGACNMFFKRILVQHLTIRKKSQTGIVVFDEGLIHHGAITSAYHDRHKYGLLTESQLLPKAAIFCTLDRDEHHKRILKRFNDRGDRSLNDLNTDFDANRIKEYLDGIENAYFDTLKACNILGIKLLTITPTPDEENIDKVLRFIEEIKVDNL